MKQMIKMAIVVIALSTSVMANAQFSQRGDWGMALGGDFRIGTHEVLPEFGFYIGAQWNVSNPIRLEASLGYGFESDYGVSTVEFNLNMHWLLPLGDRVNLYPLVGFNSIVGMTDLETTDAFQGLNLGMGLDVLITELSFLNIELRWNNEWEGLVFRIGGVRRLGAAKRPIGAQRQFNRR